MPSIPREPEREQRITMEIIVDAYGPEEQAMGWYYYLEGRITFPFTAVCVARRAISPLQPGDEIDILGMGPESECEHEMFVVTRWGSGVLAVPLSQVKPIGQTDEDTNQAVADWHYWIQRGHRL